ncbi:MAG: helix-turn-helix domain-containing protein [Cycloclasticus sp.]|nr:helix-turn-helix domain-containing protein [Cycloclasticus sp.]
MEAKQDLIPPLAAAILLCTTTRTLAKWRSTGQNNIPYKKLGRKVLYSRSDLARYLAKHSFNAVEGGES